MNSQIFIRFIFLLLTTLSAATLSQPAEVDDLLITELNKLNSFTADFTQRVIDVERTSVDPSTGKITFKRPGQFIWSYHEPYEQDIVSDGETLWVYDKDLEQVTVRPASGQATETPLEVLDHPDTVAEKYKTEIISEKNGITEIQLTPLSQTVGFKYVVLIFDATGLMGMEIYDNFDQYNSLSFENLEMGIELDGQLFAFQLPENIDVIHAAE